MSSLWKLVLGKNEAINSVKSNRFIPSDIVHPYMETMGKNMESASSSIRRSLISEDKSSISIEKLRKNDIRVNPYYRFNNIFGTFFDEYTNEYTQLKESLFNIIMHMILENELLSGLNRNEYIKREIYRDIIEGSFGDKNSKIIETFNKEKQQVILEGILKLYKVGTSLHLFSEIMVEVFKETVIYNNKLKPAELLIYIGTIKTDELQNQVNMICELFLDIKYKTEIYYQYHFAILDTYETCILDEMALY